MGTLIVTASGFSNLPASAPTGWPATVTWPGGASPNGSKTYTINDADWVKVLTWTTVSQASLQGTIATPSTPTPQQILLGWLQIWIGGTVSAIVNLFTVPAVPGPPPVIT
jgi:hypothetical protein